MIVTQGAEINRQAALVTLETINARLRRYRVLAITVTLVTLVSLVGAAVCFAWLPLGGILLVVPLYGFFFAHDLCLVNRWQQRLLGIWVEERVDLDALGEALTSLPLMPAGMLAEMFGSLPTRKRGVGKPPLAVRKGLARTLRAIKGCQIDGAMWGTLAVTAGLACLGVAAAVESWLPLLGLLAVPLVWSMGKMRSVLQLRTLRRCLFEMAGQGLDLARLVKAAGHLDWGAIPNPSKKRLLNALIKILENTG